MRKYLILTSLIVLIAIPSVYSFDNTRKGFVLGGGLGFAPAVHWELNLEDVLILDDNGKWIRDDLSLIDDNSSGFGLNFIIGYAWDEYNMIVYEGNIVGFQSFNFNFVQGFNGAAWYHYFGPKGETFFSTAGLGVYVFKPEDLKQNEYGGAILLGGGYEFSPHWQVGAYLSAGRTQDPDISGLDFKHTTFSILVSGIAF